jgi:thymidylate synthase
MNCIDEQYKELLQTIIDYGVEKKDRTGTGTKSIFGYTIRHRMNEGFPLLTTKKMAWKTMVTELLWFLRGDTNIKYLVDNDCHIWDGDCFFHYLKNVDDTIKNKFGIGPIIYGKEEFINKIKTDDEFAKKWGELGPIYGKQWRDWLNLKWEATDKADPSHPDRPMLKWKLEGIDQIQNLINDLKTNPDSRRLMVNAWNVSELNEMFLPPCHYGFQVYTRELSDEERLNWMKNNKSNVVLPMRDFNVEFSMDEWFRPYGVPKRAISLMWNQRSVDTFLGLPFNIASYGLLLEIIAKEVNMVPDELIGNLGDTHLYLNHIEQAKEQIGRELTLGERRQMVTQEMFDRIYTGGSPDTLSHSEIDQFNVPKNTREPFKLPELKIGKLVKWKECSCLPNYSVSDFTIENYQSHPSIKAPLSN